MTPMPSQVVAGAKQSIEQSGLYLVKDQDAEDQTQTEISTKGRQFALFYDAGYHTKTPEGLDFIIHNTLGDPVVGQIIRSFIPEPRWGYLRFFSDRLSSEYAWFFHIRDWNKEEEAVYTLVVQFWFPGSTVAYYNGSQSNSFNADDAENWGLLRTPTSNMDKEGITETVVDLPKGGYAIIDSRLGWTCRHGKFINIAFGTDEEVATWAKMSLPDMEDLRSKVSKLQEQGFRLNFKFE
ncbi:uncharacterized protein B0I36DRAFT_254484 [Microdochium trichocladiopsis]|uniref:Uncharacterized protein n=1 Tax=Microdochium trichocladiopsis TaxID=1682393 RepID=A0A9P8XT48_9PEZI|nr:uncharacterized protein B0I36DRAFT_254484 [Microdochium trichocladiopsis]KAH7016275.1 hypothetical protein B0I36DRAFT_254484 [Microdochium trichocladiopsis]